MANNKTITSANAEFFLSVDGLFPIPVMLEGYAADDAFSTDNLAPTETVMGVDGRLSAGFVFNPIKMKIKLSPDSNSVQIFDAWFAAMQSSRDVYFSNALINFPSLQSSFVLLHGAMTSYRTVSDAKKVVQAHEYEITWESVTKEAI